MIHAIKIQNYQSIRDEVTLDFTVTRQAPEGARYVNSSTPDVRMASVQTFIGANGSGKTTALRALSLIKWLNTKSFRDGDRNLPVNQFAGYGKKISPTKLEVVFELKQKIHIYRVSLTKDKILNEELLVRTRTKQNFTNKRIFDRTWNAKAGKYTVTDVSFGVSEAFWSSKSLAKTSLVPAAGKFGNDYAAKLVACWKSVETNIDVDDRYRIYESSPWFALDYYDSHPKMRGIVEEDLKRYDLGISSFGKNGKFTHRYGEKSFNLDFSQESSGTQQLLLLKKQIENVLTNGGVAVIDEPDAYLHPLMLKRLVKRFYDKDINVGGGQLIFSTHDIYVLDFLEKYEVNVTSKDDFGISHFRRLDSIPGVRNTDNFVKKYFEGDYGGLPILE